MGSEAVSSTEQVILIATVVVALAAFVSAGSAVASVLLTRRLAEDNRVLRKAGTEPEVVAYLGIDTQSGFFVNLVLENVGQGPACDVEFFVEADPQDFADRSVMDVTAGATQKIRSLLPQGERAERRLGVGNSLFSEDEAKRLQPFRVDVWYSTLRGVRIGPQEYPLDIAELRGAPLGTPTEKRLADSLQKIERHLGHFASGFKRLRVETITTAERQAAERERRARSQQEPVADETNSDGAQQ